MQIKKEFMLSTKPFKSVNHQSRKHPKLTEGYFYLHLALLIVFQTSTFEERCCCYRLLFKTVHGKPGVKANIVSGVSTRVYIALLSLLGEKLYD